MSNTERIQKNNAELRVCITIANSLPDADTPAVTVLQSKTVTPSKSAQEVTADEGYTALEKVTVNPIPDEYIVPSGTKAITQNGTHSVKEYDSVSVNVPIPDGYIKPSGTKTITENGTHDVTSYASVNVNVPSEEPNIQPLNITENGTYSAPDGVDGYSPVTVNVAANEDLDTELTSVEAKIAEINALLDAKSAPGYTVTIQGAYDEDYGACATYSLDNGSTWESINGYDLVLDNVKEIMFKRVGDAPIDEMKYWKESEYDEDLDPIDYDDFYFNQNYTLTENTTFRFYTAW